MTKRIERQKELVGQGIFVERESLARMIELTVRNILDEEVSRHIGAGVYERTSERRDYRNGYKPRSMKTSVGDLRFEVPQVREGTFKPSLFERYQRTERALISAMQEMYVQGVSTRKVTEVMEAICGFDVSVAQVSKASCELDEEIKRFRERRLSDYEYPYLMVDARYEKLRRNGRIVNIAVMIVIGISDEGKREILGYYAGDSESESSWSEVFKDLKDRGIKGVEMITSDAHKGIISAMRKHFQGVAWQRCRVHLMRELINKVSWRDARELIKDLKSVFVSEEKEQCLKTAEEVSAKWEIRYSSVSKSLLAGVEDTLTVLSLPGSHRRKLHSTNMLERIMRTIKARTRVISIFPNESSCERLIGALLIEKNEEWLSESKRYLNMEMKQKRV